MLEDLTRELNGLSLEDQRLVREYVEYLRWRAQQRSQGRVQASARRWRFSLLEHFGSADVRASHDAAGMEVKIGEADVGGERRPALWQHPPVRGESRVEYHVSVPAGVHNLRLRFSIGIRDGATVQDERLVAFRVHVGGFQVWSKAAWPRRWEPIEVLLPMQSGDVMRLALATDSLGHHRYAWAVWGEPELVGLPSGS